MAAVNLDDLLHNQTANLETPKAPEVSRETHPSEPVPLTSAPKVELHQPKVEQATSDAPKVEAKVDTNEYGDAAGEKSAEPQNPQASENDEYGLGVETKTYSQAEMDAYANKLIRERLARLERNQSQHQQPTQQQQQQAQQQGFQYNEDSNLDWQQQLEQFVFQAADKREQLRAQQIQRAQEEQRMAEFEGKFKNGMSKFNDYHEVVGKFPIQDDMLRATEDVKDPAALFYAAAKRMPDELNKICNMESPYARAAAVGRLDAVLRRQSAKVSSAPRPVSQTRGDDAPQAQPPKSSGNELDDLLIQDQKNRMAALQARRR